MIAAHSHSSLTVGDLPRSTAFYRDLLGFTVEAEFEAEGRAIERITALPGVRMKVVHLLLGGFRLELVQYLSPPGDEVEPSARNVGGAHIAFYCPDVERAHRELSENGVRFRSAPAAAAPGRPRVAYFFDPDGITLELTGQPPPDDR